MMYTEAIEAIMPDVRGGSTSAFWITRDEGGNWDVRRDHAGDDPFAAEYTGAYFARGSYPYVYDKVFTERLRREYEQDKTPEKSELAELFEDCAPEFSSRVMDYLTELDKPLNALCRMNVLGADENDVIDHIEGIALRRLGMFKDEPAPEKRNIEGYIERSSFTLAGKTVVCAEKPDSDDPFLVCNIRYNAFGIEERYDGVLCEDFVEAMWVYINRNSALLGEIKAEREQRGLPITPLTAADCVPGGLKEDLQGKVIVIKPEVLAPEYRSADYMLKICSGGFGAKPDSRGSAVYCKDLYTGEQARFERRDVLGVADVTKLPEWAITNLKIMLPPDKKPSILGRLEQGKQKVAQDKATNKDAPIKKRSGDLEV